MPNLRDALNQQVSTFERPPLAPLGEYRFKITRQPKQDSVSDGAYDTLDFFAQAQEALETVDPDELNAFGSVKQINLSVRFMFSTAEDEKARYEQTMFRLRQFLENHLGLPADMTLAEMLDASVGCEFLGTVGRRADKRDKTTMYAEISGTAPLAG